MSMSNRPGLTPGQEGCGKFWVLKQATMRVQSLQKHSASTYRAGLRGFCLDLPENWGFRKIRGFLWITFVDKSGCGVRGATEHGMGCVRNPRETLVVSAGVKVS